MLYLIPQKKGQRERKNYSKTESSSDQKKKSRGDYKWNDIFLLFTVNPGAIKRHNWRNITGNEMIRATIIDAFRCIQNPSAGEKKTSDTGFFAISCMNGLVAMIFSSVLRGNRRRSKTFSEKLNIPAKASPRKARETKILLRSSVR
ncbi:MAG TPA: hypothetical protein VLD55_01190 [Candidatus Sulfobium mesophilum]|nr:hypothetical protein [Candidatus Sulfobium mesophilum]